MFELPDRQLKLTPRLHPSTRSNKYLTTMCVPPAGSNSTTCGARNVIASETRLDEQALPESFEGHDGYDPSLLVWYTRSSLELADLHLLSCILGNDFVKRKKGNGPGPVKRIMKESFEMHPGSHDERDIFVKDKVSLADNTKFAIAMQMFSYAPAFVILPNAQNVSLCDAFLSGTGKTTLNCLWRTFLVQFTKLKLNAFLCPPWISQGLVQRENRKICKWPVL
jgi:hypothetical protein